MTDKYIMMSNIKIFLHNSIEILLKYGMNYYSPNYMIPQHVSHKRWI